MSRFTTVNTKIRVLESRLLTDQDFDSLINMNSVTEVAAYLKYNTHYDNILNHIDEKEIHRGQLEGYIKKDRAEEIRKITYYFKDGYKKFFQFVFMKLEIEDLKKILRIIKTGNISDPDKESLINIGLYCKVDKEVLLNVKTVSEFIKVLRYTLYYKYLKPFEADMDNKTSFMGEMVLDLAYFEIFFHAFQKLDLHDKRLMYRLQGNITDLLNVQWIYRGLKYYSFSRELLFNYTIPRGYRLNIKEIRKLCYCENIYVFKDELSKYKYDFLFEEEDIYMERRYLRYIYKKVKRLKSVHGMDISEAIAFDMLLDFEIRDIITVIEGIRYGLSPEQTKRFLIREL